jgi:SAM-dependent methyltransferase
LNLTYPEIFRQRGDLYHAAMLRHPAARAAEFAALFSATPVRAGARVLDVPAGGGYLARHLPATELVSLELTSGFGTGLPTYDPGAAWTWGRFDHIVCLAALHHIDDQPGFLSGLLRGLARGGTLHLADVARDSSMCAFLDGFVGRYNLTGHEGSYLPTDEAFFARIGHVARIEEAACPWVFPGEAEMLEFCAQLFGLVDCPPDALLEALARHVGVERTSAGVRLDWRLLYVDLQSPAG